MDQVELIDTLAEEATLGSILINPGAITDIVDKIKKEDFSLLKNQWIYEALLSLWADNGAIDFITLTDKLREHGRLDDIGVTYLTKLSRSVPSSVNAEHYAKIVHELSLRRQLVATCGIIASKAYDRSVETIEVVSTAERELLSIETQQGDDPRLIKEDLSSILQTITSRDPNDPNGNILSGIADLDALLGGLPKGEMIIIAGRPSMGKTSLILQQAYVAAMGNKTTLVFSLEMSRERLIERLLTLSAKLSHNNSTITGTSISRGTLKSGEIKALSKIAKNMEGVPLIIDDKAIHTPLSILSRSRRVRSRHGLDLIVIDYLQLLSSGRNLESRVSEFTEISKQIKALARELDVPVLVASQLSRGVEQRHNKRPVLADLRESGAIEQDTDIAIFLYRDDYYNPDTTDRPNVAELILSKNRNGPTGVVHVYFNKECYLFSNLAKKWMI